MALFLSLYISIYFLLHLYGFIHVYRSLGLRRRSFIFAGLFSLFMVSAPILVRIAEREELETVARLLAHAAYAWMGLLFLFVAVAVFYDFFGLLAWLVKIIRQQPAGMDPADRRKRFFVQVVIVLLIYGYGLFEANRIRTTHITITTPKISKRVDRFRIVQISDVHLGLLVGEERLTKILAMAREAEPDLLVSTGDLVDGQPADLDRVKEMLARFTPPFGKLAVVGNHEVYAGLKRSRSIIAEAGFLLLRNESIHVNGIAFAGVDDPTADDPDGKTNRITEAELLRRQNRGTFTVLLKHRPKVNPKSVGLFDIQLSGHTHNGQIFPFTLFTRLAYPFPGGMNMLEYGSLYVSSGCGTWGPPIRFIAPPELVVIDLVPQS